MRWLSLLVMFCCLTASAATNRVVHLTVTHRVKMSARPQAPSIVTQTTKTLALPDVVTKPHTNPPVLLMWTPSLDPLATSNRVYAVIGNKTNVTAASNTNQVALVITNRTSLDVTAVDTVTKLESLPSNVIHWPSDRVYQFASKSGTNMQTSASVRGPWALTNALLLLTNPAGSRFFRAIGGVRVTNWLSYTGP